MEGIFIQIKEINKSNCSIYLKGNNGDLYSAVIPKCDLEKLHLNDVIDFNSLSTVKKRIWLFFPKNSKYSGIEPTEAFKSPVDLSLLDYTGSDEVPEIFFREGKAQIVYVNRYERNEKARDKCIEYWGYKCYVCGVILKDIYGEIAEGFIHVHHLKDLSLIGKEYSVDPINDLRPLCPNCHSIVHLETPAMNIDKLKTLLK